MMGGALGLAILASLAANETSSLAAAGQDHLEALVGGYHVAFIAGAVFAALAAVIGGTLLRTNVAALHGEPEHVPVGEPALAEGS